MRHRFTTGYAAGLALAATVAVAGCTTSTPDPPATSAVPSASTTASSGTTSSAAPSSSGTASTTVDPSIPAAARENTPEGAQAFTLYVGTVFDNAFSTLNEQLLTPLVLPNCKTCSGAATAISGYKEKQQRYIGKWANFTDAVFSNSENNLTKVIASSDQRGAKVLDASGGTVRTIPASTGKLSVQLQFDTQWRVAEMQGIA